MSLISAHLDHRRRWDDFVYVYPVISRRSKGVSIGINLNPDKVCNFDCIYCEVDRNTPARRKDVDLQVLEQELRSMLEIYQTGELFEREPFASAPEEWRRLNDIAFSGDGEPTTCPIFDQVVAKVFQLRETLAGAETKLVLITDSACLTRPLVTEGLRQMQKGAHEIWAKLDAGTESYYKIVNRTAIDYNRILDNIAKTAAWVPLMIQSLFLRIHGEPPSAAEIEAYGERLLRIQESGGKILKLQLYTIARPTPEPFATALSNPELDAIAKQVFKKTGIPQEIAYGI